MITNDLSAGVTEVIILAGGMGTRLRDSIDKLPKPMAPVNGKPFLFHLLTWLKNYNVEKIILSTGYRSESITGYFGDSFSGIPVGYAVEHKALGTGGAIMFAMQKCTSDNIVVVNGDTFFPINLDKFFRFHEKMGNIFSIALKPMKDVSRYGTVECEGDTILGFNEKRLCKEGLINGGIYIINREFLGSQKLPETFSIESDVLEKLAGSSLLKCMIFDEPFIDIGIPEDYYRAGDFLKGLK
jgi:D-glycero-alpha-D-manno-heptose 1-phosphate guanylyltransferase